ncbi:dipeptide/oligopeptide/nickel ABC transporter permease/ATP-binding protein [Streptomyces sp. NPDC004838]
MTSPAEITEITETTGTPRASNAPSLARRVLRKPIALASLVFLGVVAVSSLAASWIAPYDPLEPDPAAILSGPSASHLLGTDTLGRDVLSRLLYAGESALGLALLAVAVAVVLAVPVGVFAGLARGWADAVTTRVADVLLAVPGIVIMLMVLALFDQNMAAAMVALGMIFAPGLLRVARAAAIAVSQEPYIAAARVSGLNQVQIAFRHVLPRVVGPVLVNLSVIAGSALLTQTGLNFLGLGVNPPNPSWGGMVADASAAMELNRWLLVPTGGIVALSVIALVLLGDAVRDATTERWAGQRSHGRAKPPAKQPDPTVPDQARSVSETATDGDDPIIRVDNLTVALPARQEGGGWNVVVQNVSFTLGRGETIGLVGESGCGKTLTCLALLDLLPTGGRVIGGRVTIDGVDTATMSARERARLRGSTIAFISQDPMAALDPNYTVGSQIGEAVRVHSGRDRQAARERTLRLLEQVRIPDPEKVARLYPHQLSGGMAQRVSIAIALAGEPSVLIADEPTTALDVTVQAEILRLLTGIQQETGMAMLLISHDWGVVAGTCGRCLVMYAGEIVEMGTVTDLLDRPLHPYSEGLLAADPHVSEPGRRLATIPGSVPTPGDWPNGCRFQPRCRHAVAECSAHPVPLEEPAPRHHARCLRSHVLAEGGTSERDTPAERA